jgi:peptide/nickel transport system substrate-binding protein
VPSLFKKNNFSGAGKPAGFFGFIKTLLRPGRQPAEDSGENLDQRLVYSLAPKKIPGVSQLKHLYKTLNPRELWIIRVLAVIIAGNLIFIGVRFYFTHLQITPAHGGDYTEAIVGSPQTTNPLYTLGRDADSDLSSLLYSSLLRRDKTENLVGDLASSWTMSADGRSYTVVLRADAKWSNNNPVTVGDVIFTFNAFKDQDYNSPWRSVFVGVDIDKVDDQTIRFTLVEPYADFPQLLTFGVLPEAYWSTVAPENAALAELNLKPVGSGPYKFSSYVKNQDGDIKEYDLSANGNYYGGAPYIDKIIFKFYPNYTEAVSALNNKDVDGLAYLPTENKKDLLSQNSLHFYNLPLTQLGTVFFNAKSNDALGDKIVRQALAQAIDRDKIVKEAFGGFAAPAVGVLLPSSPGYNAKAFKQAFDPSTASQILTADGWKAADVNQADIDFLAAAAAKGDKLNDPLWLLKQDIVDTASSSQINPIGSWRYHASAKAGGDVSYLTVELTAPDSFEYSTAANIIKADWEALGVRTTVKIVPAAQIDSDVVRPRNFEALLLTESLGHDPDPYFFWHSSQSGTGGLNLSAYVNKDVDALLEAIRQGAKADDRLAKLSKFQELIAADAPAAFVYYPEYVYIQSKKVSGFSATEISDPRDRFNNIVEWYVKQRDRLVW